MQEMLVWSLGQKDLLEKEMANHSSILTWEIPWTEEHGGLQSMGTQRIRHAWAPIYTQRISRLETNPRQQLSDQTEPWLAEARPTYTPASFPVLEPRRNPTVKENERNTDQHPLKSSNFIQMYVFSLQKEKNTDFLWNLKYMEFQTSSGYLNITLKQYRKIRTS